MRRMKPETRLFVRDLSHLDCAWFDPDHGLSGETWRVDVELAGELAEDGMLCDFGIVKSTLKQFLDRHVDHRLLLSATQARQLDGGDQRSLELRSSRGEDYSYCAPATSFAELDCAELTTASLQLALQAMLQPLMPDNISALKIQLLPAFDQGAYHYCHGLKSHAGNCQRMAHGHRAQLEIEVAGQRHSALERHWQERLQQRYIGSAEHMSTQGPRHRYAYRGSQGDFELLLPASRSYPLEAEPTIEHLSAHMAREVAAECPGQAVRCRAFEGIGKGALSSLTVA